MDYSTLGTLILSIRNLEDIRLIPKEIILTSAIFLSIGYFVVALLAFQHFTDEEKKSKGHVLLLMDIWWPFYSSCYTNAARKFRVIGKVLLPIIIVLYIWYFVVAAEQ